MLKESMFYPIMKILLPTDGSKYSIKAAKYAAEIAKKHEAELTLFHVLEMAFVEQQIDFGSKLGLKRIAVPDEKEIKERARKAIEKTLEAIDKTMMPCETKYFCSSSAREAICEIAEKEKFDLIVMGNKGVSGVKRLMLGSVAEGVCRSAPCPVLIVR